MQVERHEGGAFGERFKRPWEEQWTKGPEVSINLHWWPRRSALQVGDFEAAGRGMHPEKEGDATNNKQQQPFFSYLPSTSFGSFISVAVAGSGTFAASHSERGAIEREAFESFLEPVEPSGCLQAAQLLDEKREDALFEEWRGCSPLY